MAVCPSQAVSKRANCSDVNHYNADGRSAGCYSPDYSCLAQLVAGGREQSINGSIADSAHVWLLIADV